MNKSVAIRKLENKRTEENSKKVDEIIEKIMGMSDENWKQVLIQKNITSEVQIENIVDTMLADEGHKFIELNNLIQYGIIGDTLHIHVVPKDIHSMLSRKGLQLGELKLIDALEKIQKIIKDNPEYKDVKEVYAVSGILREPIINIFGNLGFDTKSMLIEQAKQDSELASFYETFKNHKKLGRAKLSVGKLFSQEWNAEKENKKAKLKFKTELETEENEKNKNEKVSEESETKDMEDRDVI